MPFFANHHQQLTVSTNIGLPFPDPSSKPQSLPALAGKKGKQFRAFFGKVKPPARFSIKAPQTRASGGRVFRRSVDAFGI
jgi:hypothetical protein